MVELENPEVMRRVISLVSAILERVSETNDLNGRFGPQRISVFHGLIRPSISIQSYLDRIFTYANCSPSCLIVAYIYLDRFSEKQPFFPISSFNVHRLIITSVMVSAKFMDDLFYNNAFYAKVGGISTMEMNMLEMDFLFGLGFELNVTPTTFYSYCSCIHKEIWLQHPPFLPPTSSIHNNLGPDQDLHFRTSDDEPAHRQQQLVV
ncbi:OLC1v1027083C1 [Oldenlandia corymbosa var. corymbosa]|uniref:Cyclin n=1 Tax=Oldenlandia corymbosa var. corymbosa TaxID=529605 RepID=A0AAV1CBC2_OLDCO|nr:OLC1v1027083C1 [Oldenlandia corymbosa var. corymbosa]